MNYLRQLYIATRLLHSEKRVVKTINEGLSFGDSRITLYNRTYEWVSRINKNSQSFLPILRQAYYQHISFLRKILTFIPNQDWTEAKEYYEQLKKEGYLVEARAEDLEGKYLTQALDRGVIKGKEYSSYLFTGGGYDSDIPESIISFLCTYIHSSKYTGESVGTEDYNFPVSQCRLATEKEIEIVKSRMVERETVQKRLNQTQKRLTGLYKKLNNLK